MGHFGFSYIGLIWLLMLFVPNILWIKCRPKEYSSEGENKFLAVTERVGEVGVTCSALIFSDFNLRPWSGWSIFFVLSALCMILYEAWWIKYFSGARELKDFYGSFLKIPLPGAVLPVAAFLFLGIYGRVVWLIAGAVVLGIGHIGIHFGHRKNLKKSEKEDSDQ